MARIPTIETNARPTPQPSGAVASIGAGDPSALTAGGQVTVQQGGMIMHAGDVLAARQKEFEKEAEREQLKVDTLRAEDQTNKLREKEAMLKLGDNGYTKVQGTAALSRPLMKDYGDMFDVEVKGLMDELGNDQQKELFRQRAQIINMQYKEGILHHLATQNKAAQKQQLEGTIAVELKAAAANWNDPMLVAFSIERIRNGINTQADNEGWKPIYTEAKTKEVLGQLHDSVIDQMVNSGQLVRAQEWFNTNRSEIDVKTAKDIEKKTVDAKQHELFNGYQASGLANRDSIPALKQLLGQVGADKTLSDDRKNILVGRFEGRIDSLEKLQQSIADRAERRASTEVNAMIARVNQGWEPTTEEMGAMLQASRGRPQLSGLVGQLIQTANVTRDFRQALPITQERMLTQAELAVRQGLIPPKTLETMRSIKEGQKKIRDQDPTTWSVRQGIIDPNDLAAKPLDLTNPDPNQLQARFAHGRDLVGKYLTPFKPGSDEEVKLATAVLRESSPPQRREFFRKLSQASGNDIEGYKAIMQQIAPDDPVVAVAGTFVRDPQRSAAADRILDGLSILRPNKTTDGKSGGTLLPQPKEHEMRKEWDNYVKDAYTGSASGNNVSFQTAQAIYASLSKKSPSGDNSVLNRNLWDQAMKEATGGVTDVHGKKVVKPWGMSDGEFADQRDARLKMLVASGNLAPNMSLSRLRDLQWAPVGEGLYELRSGDETLGDKTGKPIEIDFNKPLPATISRAPFQPDLARGAAARDQKPRMMDQLTK